MKTFTLKFDRKLTARKCWLFSLFFVLNLSFAQIQNNGIINIADNTSLCLAVGNHFYGISPAQTTTTRTVNNYGRLVYGAGSSWSGATNAHFTNGYVQTIGTSQFIFPIGQSGVYAPAAAVPTTTDGVDGAYYNSTPSAIGIVLDGTVSTISSVEYWHIKSPTTQAKISLTWRSSSNVTGITTGSLVKLIIAGWNGTQWIQVPSTVDTTSILGGASTLTSGSITSTFDVNLSTYTAFTLASKGDCNPLVLSSGITKTYNGSWSPSVPTLVDPVIISAPYSGNLKCNSLVLNANITLADGQSVEIINGVTGSAKIIMASQASVSQRNSTAAAPSIELTKQTRDMHKYDYVYMGTPISGDFFSQLSGAQALTGATTGAFDLKYKYVSGAGGGWQTLTSIATGKGYIMRVAPVAPFATAATVDKINLKFTGVSNNGDLTVPITQNPALPNSGLSHNLLANPYPSAMDGDMFLRQNNAIDGVIYVWQQSTAPGTSTATQYAQADYLVYTKAGTANPFPGMAPFDGKIASGQSFKVKALSTGTVNFNNCMRLTGNNTNFFRNSNAQDSEIPADRYKLSLTDENDIYSQILVTYAPNCTLGYDRMFDAGRNSVSTTQLYSLLDTDNRKLAINARPDFATTDVVKLGMSKSAATIGQYTINIEDKEGIFANGQTVYLHDKELDIYHDLNSGSYTFSSTATSNNIRFEAVYQSPSLSNSKFSGFYASANINKEMLNVKANQEMVSIEIYDLTGKKIANYEVKNNTIFNTNFNHAEGIYIAKIKLSSNNVVTQKLINIK